VRVFVETLCGPKQPAAKKTSAKPEEVKTEEAK
jgi:hypothetical protein